MAKQIARAELLGAAEVLQLIGGRSGGRPKLSVAGRALLAQFELEALAAGDDAGNERPLDAGEEPPPPITVPKIPGKDGADSGEAGEGACCESLVVRLERIKIVRLTTPQTLLDDVVVTALSHGKVMNPSPLPFAWPLDIDGEIESLPMDAGDERNDTPLIARVEIGQNCDILLNCNINFWEEDPEDLGDLLRESAEALVRTLAASQGVSVPASTSALISRILKDIARQLGLTNDNMGQYAFSVSGRLNCGAEIDQLSWDPTWGRSYAHEKLDKNTARLKRTLRHNGGIWETSILVQRICPGC